MPASEGSAGGRPVVFVVAGAVVQKTAQSSQTQLPPNPPHLLMTLLDIHFRHAVDITKQCLPVFGARVIYMFKGDMQKKK